MWTCSRFPSVLRNVTGEPGCRRSVNSSWVWCTGAVLTLLSDGQKRCSPFATCYLSPGLTSAVEGQQSVPGHTSWNSTKWLELPACNRVLEECCCLGIDWLFCYWNFLFWRWHRWRFTPAHCSQSLLHSFRLRTLWPHLRTNRSFTEGQRPPCIRFLNSTLFLTVCVTVTGVWSPLEICRWSWVLLHSEQFPQHFQNL